MTSRTAQNGPSRSRLLKRPDFRRDGQGFYEPAHKHIFVVPADGGAPRQLTYGDFDHDGPLAWMPDGQSIVFAANRNEGWELETIESDLYAVGLDGTLTRLTDMPGAESAPAVSANGTIAFVRSENKGMSFRVSELYVMERPGLGARSLTPDLDRSVRDLQWTADATGVYFQL